MNGTYLIGKDSHFFAPWEPRTGPVFMHMLFAAPGCHPSDTHYRGKFSTAQLLKLLVCLTEKDAPKIDTMRMIITEHGSTLQFAGEMDTRVYTLSLHNSKLVKRSLV